MRIAQIVPSLEARHGGPSVSVPALSCALARRGHRVTLLAGGPDNQPSPVEANLAVQIFPRNWPQRLGTSQGLRQALEANEAEIFHHHGLWLRPLHYADLRARATGTPLVISPRGMMAPWAWQHHRGQKFLAEHFVHPGAFGAAAGWHATSEAEAGDIRARGFSQPVCVAPNGVAPPDPTKTDEAKAYWLAQCPELATRPAALFHSRFHEKKRVLELIDLWLERAPTDWLLLLVGIPESYTVAQLQDRVQRRGAADRVKIFDGTSTPQPYAIASLFLLPSHSENFGLVVAEALANGVPAVVTDTMPWQSMQSSGHGWCVAWNRFAEALGGALAEGPARLRERGVGARNWVLREYSWDKGAERLADFYDELRRNKR
jgi:glycosyltransferase involved in cell wall biosynthesis